MTHIWQEPTLEAVFAEACRLMGITEPTTRTRSKYATGHGKWAFAKSRARRNLRRKEAKRIKRLGKQTTEDRCECGAYPGDDMRSGCPYGPGRYLGAP